MPAFFFTIQIKGKRIPIPLPIILPFTLLIEILAIPPLIILAVRKKEYIPLKFVLGLYLSRLIINLILYGRNFKVKVCEGKEVVRISGSL